MAMCVMAVVGEAPCQCFSPGGNQITSPGRISSIGPPQRCTRPQPAVTIRVCPSGCVCHAVRAPGSNVTIAPVTRAGSLPLNGESMRTVPVNQSAGPLLEGCEPLRLISIVSISSFAVFTTDGHKGTQIITVGRRCRAASAKQPVLRSRCGGWTASPYHSLQLLARRPEQNFIHVHVVRLAHR